MSANELLVYINEQNVVKNKDGLPIGIAKDNSSGRSVPYKLLTVTDKTYVVISPMQDEESIEISRDAVQGIVVSKELPRP